MCDGGLSCRVVGLAVTGEGLGFSNFAMRYPWVIVQMLTFSLASAVGQVSEMTASDSTASG